MSIRLSGAEGGPCLNILHYGAHNDGSARSTAAINSAIQAASAAGGGTVYIPAGNYVTGPIVLTNNLVLDIAAGATLRFPAMRLPFTQGREQGIECLTPVPLIGGRNLHNVTIRGRGVLTTDNAAWLKLMPRTNSSKTNIGTAFGSNWEHMLHDLEIETPAPAEDYLKAAPELRPSFVRFMDSTNILIEGVRFVGSSMWTIHLLYTDNAVVRNVIIETYPGVQTDGIAVDSSRNIRISDCYIDTGDDGIVLKSGKTLTDGGSIGLRRMCLSRIALCITPMAPSRWAVRFLAASVMWWPTISPAMELKLASASKAGAGVAARLRTSGSTIGQWKMSASGSTSPVTI